MSNDTHPLEMIVGLMSPEIKDAIGKLLDLHTQTYGLWPKSGSSINDHRARLFDKDNWHILKEVIIPDLTVMQVSSYQQKNYLRSIDRTILNKEYITTNPILFIYEFTGHNSLVINKIHISIWCQHKKVYPDEDEIEMHRYEYMDQYLESLIEFLNKLPDLKVVNLNMTHDEDTIEMLTKNCQYFKITKATELKLRSHRELKLNKRHLSDKLNNNNFKLNVHLEYMVISWAPWEDPATGMTRYYQPTPKEEEAWKDLE